MLAYLGWVAAAFLGGLLLGLWLRNKRPSLRENFARVEFFNGRSYREILVIAGAKPHSIIEKVNGRTLRIWKEHGYSISLEFDVEEICLGVMDELYQ